MWLCYFFYLVTAKHKISLCIIYKIVKNTNSEWQMQTDLKFGFEFFGGFATVFSYITEAFYIIMCQFLLRSL